MAVFRLSALCCTACILNPLRTVAFEGCSKLALLPVPSNDSKGWPVQQRECQISLFYNRQMHSNDLDFRIICFDQKAGGYMATSLSPCWWARLSKLQSQRSNVRLLWHFTQLWDGPIKAQEGRQQSAVSGEKHEECWMERGDKRSTEQPLLFLPQHTGELSSQPLAVGWEYLSACFPRSFPWDFPGACLQADLNFGGEEDNGFYCTSGKFLTADCLGWNTFKITFFRAPLCPDLIISVCYLLNSWD